jgi:release factor glutamine methyltransferase
VLIPRPETEELVDWIVKENAQRSMHNVQFSIIDIGTGSGCIPITIKNKLHRANVSAIDVCSEALFTATENSIEYNTEIDFILLDFLDEKKWETLGQFDIVVSNPPYVRQSEREKLHARVKEFEPDKALFVPDDDALLFYRKLSDFSLKHLKAGGTLFVEINEALGGAILNLFRDRGFANIELRKDMQGKDRMVKAKVVY